MSRSDADTAAALYRAWDEEGLDAVADRYWHEEIEWHDPVEFPDAQVHRGREAAKAGMQRAVDAIGHFRHELVAVRQAGDEVLADVVVHGAGSAGGVPVQVPTWQLLRFRDGRVDRVRVFFDRLPAEEAAGVDPSDEVAIAAALYRLWNEEGLDAVAERYWHEEIEWHDPPQLPDAATHHGRAAAKAALQAMVDAIGHFDVDVRGMRRPREGLLVEFIMRGTGTAGGVPWEVPCWHLLRFRDGRMHRVQAFLFDRATAERAAGL